MKNSGLDITEYILVAGSVVGSALAAISKEIVFVAAPLSASLVLNLINRRRFQELKQANFTAEIVQVDEKYSREIQSLRSSVQALPTQTDLGGVREAINTELQQRLAPIEELEINPIRQDISQLREQYIILQEAILGINNNWQEAGVLSDARLQSLESGLAQLQTYINELQAKLQKLANQTQSGGNLQTLETEIDNLKQRLNSLPKTQILAQDIEELKAALSQIKRDELTTETAANIDIPSPQILAEIEENIANLKEQVSNLNKLFKKRPELEQIEQFKSRLANLEKSRQNLGDTGGNSGIIETEIYALREDVNAVNELLQQYPEPEEIEDLRVGLRRLEQETKNFVSKQELVKRLSESELEKTVGNLREELNNFSDRLKEKAEAYQLEQMKNTLVKAAKDIANLQQRYNNLPEISSQTIDSSSIAAELEKLSQGLLGIDSRLAPLEIHEELNPIYATIAQLREQINSEDESLESIRESMQVISDRLESLASLSRVESLENNLNQLSQRINHWQQEFTPISELSDNAGSGTNEKLKELENAIARTNEELSQLVMYAETRASKKSLARHRTELEQLITELRESYISGNDEWQQVRDNLQQLRAEITNGLPLSSENNIAMATQDSLARLAENLTEIQANLTNLQNKFAPLEGLEIDAIRQDISHLQKSLIRIETRQIATIQEALTKVQTEVENMTAKAKGKGEEVGEENLSDRQEIENRLALVAEEINKIQNLVDQAVEVRIQEINQQLKAIRSYDYELVFDRPTVRAILIEALAQAKERIIIVCPWISRSAITPEIIEKIEASLQRNCRIDIGWGHLRDIDAGEFPLRVDRQGWQTNYLDNGKFYDALNDLENLGKKYPQQLNLKILGTHENFLVCDKSFAWMGSHHFLTVSDRFPEREVGIRTNDSRIIVGLINRFEEPILNPHQVSAYLKRGLERLYVGDYQNAISDYTEALKLDPENATAYNDLGVAYSSIGENIKAIENYNLSLKINPNQAATYFNRGVSRYQVGEIAGAIEDYTQGMNLSSEDAVAYNNRGRAKADLGDFAGAIADYSEALLINPTDAVIYYNRAIALATQDDYNGSIADFDRAISINPDYAAAHYNRGLARCRIGDLHRGVADLQAAAELFSQQGDSESSEKAIEALKCLQQ